MRVVLAVTAGYLVSLSRDLPVPGSHMVRNIRQDDEQAARSVEPMSNRGYSIVCPPRT